MKKMLCLSSSLILASSAVTILATNANNCHSAIKDSSANKINWTSVENYNNNYFKNIKKYYYKNSNLNLISYKSNQVVNADIVIDYAKQKADSYTMGFKNKNYDLNLIIKILSQSNPEFAKNYSDVLSQKNKILDYSTYYSTNSGLLKNASFSSLENYVHNLKIAKTTFVSISAAAAVAAAAFWAAAWWFGISIPWAVGSTAASALAGGIAGGINIALVKYDSELSGIDKATISLSSIYKLGHIFYSVLNPILIGSAATATSLSWAFPAILSIIPLVSAILAWINLFS